jgi:hypothetical protein
LNWIHFRQFALLFRNLWIEWQLAWRSVFRFSMAKLALFSDFVRDNVYRFSRWIRSQGNMIAMGDDYVVFLCFVRVSVWENVDGIWVMEILCVHTYCHGFINYILNQMLWYKLGKATN